MPKAEKSCVERFAKFFPDYKIIRWDERNFDINYNEYVSQAYAAGKFSYVSDVCRLYALYNYGGVYLDADCKVLKSFDDLLDSEAFTGFGGDNKEIAACTLAFKPGHPFIKEFLSDYECRSFLKDISSLRSGYLFLLDSKIVVRIFCKLGFLAGNDGRCGHNKNGYK